MNTGMNAQDGSEAIRITQNCSFQQQVDILKVALYYIMNSILICCRIHILEKQTNKQTNKNKNISNYVGKPSKFFEKIPKKGHQFLQKVYVCNCGVCS